MGAANAIRAYATYGAVIGDHAMRALVYMALVARDGDAEPWFGLGLEALSDHAFSRPVPDKNSDAGAHEAALRSMGRVMTELRNAGAVRTITRARFGARQAQNARYRLYLDEPCATPRPPDGKRPVDKPPPPDANRPMAPDVPWSPNGETTGRFVTGHRTFCDRPPDAQRPTKEEEEEGGANTSRSNVSTTTVEGAGTAREQDQHFQPSFLLPVPGQAPSPGRPSRWRDPQQTARKQVAAARTERERREGSAAS